MKAQAKKTTNLVIGAMLVVAVLAVAFWILLLSPKRDEADKLSGQVQSLEASLSQHRDEADAAALARRSFSSDYQRLVLLGKAVPGDDETASLLVQLSQVAKEAGVKFGTLTLSGGGGTEGEATASVPSGASPTEASASLLPLGASIGTTGLAVMPYSLTFEGGFFKIADFIEGLDNLVKTTNEDVAVDGRLITVNSFSLSPASEGGAANLQATFSVTTYVTPPGEGLADGVVPAAPEPAAASLSSATIGAAP